MMKGNEGVIMNKPRIRAFISDFFKISEPPPEEGALCLVIFPVAELSLSENVPCHSATAYFRHGVWVYADEPTALRFEPCYYLPISFVS